MVRQKPMVGEVISWDQVEREIRDKKPLIATQSRIWDQREPPLTFTGDKDSQIIRLWNVYYVHSL